MTNEEKGSLYDKFLVRVKTQTFVSFCLASGSALSLSIAFLSDMAFSSASDCNKEENMVKISLPNSNSMSGVLFAILFKLVLSLRL